MIECVPPHAAGMDRIGRPTPPKPMHAAGLRGKRVREPSDRIHRRESAGDVVADDGAAPPEDLALAPVVAASPTPHAYAVYVQALANAQGK